MEGCASSLYGGQLPISGVNERIVTTKTDLDFVPRPFLLLGDGDFCISVSDRRQSFSSKNTENPASDRDIIRMRSK